MALQPYPKQLALETEMEEAETVAPAEAEATERRQAPSWFPPQRLALEEAAERYRAMRSEVMRGREVPGSARSSLLDREINRSFGIETDSRAERRVEKRAPLAPSRRAIAERALEEFEFDFRAEDRTRRKRRGVQPGWPGAMPSGLPVKYIGAGLAAIVMGAMLGYGATHYKAVAAKADEIASLVKPQVAPAVETEPAAVTVLAKKTVATATLNVSDVSGELNSMIALMLHADPGEAGGDLVLKLSGLPPSAYLTAGAKAEDNAWQLAAAEAAGVKLVVPQTSEPSFEVAVAAFEAKTGELVAPIKEMTVAIDDASLQIAPAAAAPESVTIKKAEQSKVAAAVPKEEEHIAAVEPKEEQIAAVEEPQAQNLLAKGDILLKSGDLGMARQFYERAFVQGSAEAAIGMGKTYDPAVYAELKVHGLKPDPGLAMEWYTRASAAGNADADEAIEALKRAQE